ncbi:DNA polymerase III subunit delta [Treponema rectale]|uniref:DNA polymerase III subunit delta n=1 Tax=Treponema rectale TaxID=744512 RepID=A0A7M1XIR8_9SPIR|nr:DNA polymerase III subunit delta [Treponema rectale]
MVKVYYGVDSGFTAHRAEKELKKTLSKEEYQEIIRFDGYKDLCPSVVEDCSSISLFGDKKIVLFSNAYFLSSSSNRKAPFTDAQQGNYRSLIEYFNAPSPDTDLYIVVDGELKKSGELYTAMQESSDVYLEKCDLPSDEDYQALAVQTAKAEGKEIDTDALKMLLSRSRTVSSGYGAKGIDYLTFMNSLNKLLTYTKHVTTVDVETLVYRPLEDNVFALIDKLMKKNTRGAMLDYHDIRAGGVEPLGIIPAFGAKFREYALTKYLIEMSYNNNQIAEQLSKVTNKMVKPGSIYYRRQDLAGLSFAKMIQILNDLAELEVSIKLHQDDADTRMEVFLSTFCDTYFKRSRNY